MEPLAETTVSAFLVHAWMHQGQLRLCGRDAQGRSFAATLDAASRSALLAEHQKPTQPNPWKDFSPQSSSHNSDPGFREDEDFLLRMGIRGGMEISGPAQQGSRVQMVFTNPKIKAVDIPPQARWLSIDIETNRDNHITAVSLCSPDWPGEVHFLTPAPHSSSPATDDLPAWIIPHASEKGLLDGVMRSIIHQDPDVITGWSVVDFDLNIIAQRCKDLGLRFDIGRTRDEEARLRKAASGLMRAVIPGRQVVDALRIMRASGERYDDLRLDTVAQAVLGRGKTVHETGSSKLDELDRLYRNSPEAFCDYCLQDSRLVLDILAATGLDRLSLARAALTGTSLELAWTSIPAFERIYALELYQQGISPPGPFSGLVSGAAGGTVLDPESGMYQNVWVFDFKSLYPTIMRTFNIDPLSYARALSRSPDPEQDIRAPNGARFDRSPGILRPLIAQYFQARLDAQARGDETAAYVYKILMNSFYGVLGSSGCRYGRTDLAGAITSFGKFFLLSARDFFTRRSMDVLYGDTDSVFVHAGPERTDQSLPTALARELNAELAQTIGQAWGCESHVQIRFEKRYSSFMIPRLRSGNQSEEDSTRIRGRAKGYAGLNTDTGEVEIKGMEAARSDYTALAVRFQRELLPLLFHQKPAQELDHWLKCFLADLHAGKLDAELIYRKILRRPAQDYTANEPPQVKVARELGWTTQRGRVEYIMTASGPHAIQLCKEKPDYRHYVVHQLIPIWESLADAADRPDGRTDLPPRYMALRPFNQDAAQGQLELGWQ